MRCYNISIIVDQRAEGASAHDDQPAETADDPRSVRQAGQLTDLKSSQLSVTLTAPVAETGIMPIIVMEAEGDDDADRQDATRTAAEAQFSAPKPAAVR
jgi:hypothetical protein